MPLSQPAPASQAPIRLCTALALGMLLLLLTAIGSPAAAQQTKIDLPLGDGPAPYAEPLGNLLAALAQYARWPTGEEPASLCLLGASDHAAALAAARLPGGRALAVRPLDPSAYRGAGCDIAWFGRLALEEQRELAAASFGQPVLTISESDTACRGRAMVCVLFEAQALRFRVNLDAIARSQVRVDPRVLRMAEPVGHARAGAQSGA